MKQKITIVGLGGVGGYFGFKLAQHFGNNPEIDISFIARGATYETVKTSGLTLLSPENTGEAVFPDNIAEDVSGLPDTTIYLICVKEYDLENICKQLRPLVKEDTIMIPLMNGVDIYERIRKIIPTGIVLPSCVYVASHIKEKGTVEHKGNPGRIITGKDPQHPEYNPQTIINLLQAAAIDIELTDDAFPAIWTKYFFIASFGLVSARYNQSIGQVNENPELHLRAEKIMGEILAIAQVSKINLPADIIHQTFKRAESFPYATPTSLQLDVQSGKEHTELALFSGAIIRLGQQFGLPVEETLSIEREIQSLSPS